ncbi:MAG: thermonuclease family protein [Candidatus Dojkabacteria bacterium]|nr:MAG: thermonuclease family protein [Candidatus Dojkabacteria bacterium]
MLVILFAVIAYYESRPTDDGANNKEQAATDTTLHEVTRVIDGDTIEIIYQGEPVSVRLIGINAPELSPEECYANESKQYLESLLPVGSQVAIQFDETQGERDRYDRLLLYIWNDELFINEMLIAEGAATEYTYDNSYEYDLSFKEAEHIAEISNKGLWGGSCACDRSESIRCSDCELAEVTRIAWDCSIEKSTLRDTSCTQQCDVPL